MGILTMILVALVAAEHLYFLILEMFLWHRPLGLKTFKMTREMAESTRALAANQGLYNGFLAAGLLYGMVTCDGPLGFAFLIFFLICVIIAGLFGAATISRRILYVQALPGALALAALLLRGI
ncbi:MAG TPA: DUF1304 domain-containing protein [Stellaceae bacterium]|nr:DUF1304 domain-containing protein [Stellaceae bacterium]